MSTSLACMRTADPVLPVVFDRSEALGAGLSSGQVQRRVAAGQWNRLRWGRFALAGLDGDRRWRAEVIAVVRSHRRSLILSHSHAARAWRLPCPLGGWGPLTFTSVDRPVSTSGRMKVLNAPLPEDDLAPMGQVVVTSPARTVLDCARSLPPRDALAIADAALRTRLCGRAGLDAVRDRMRGWPGIAKARAVLALADGRRETALESWSAWSFHEQQVPPPLWQATLCDTDGAFLGRTDGWWAAGVAGEADGRAKYGLTALERGGLDADGLAAALDDERRREQRLRRAGVLVVRWTAGDVLDHARSRALAADLRSALGRGGRFTGRVILL